MSENRRSYLLLHLTVFIWGWTAILGKLITRHMSAFKLVWLRLPIALVGIIAYLLIRKVSLRITRKQALIYFLVALDLTIHWITFYLSIEVSNASVTLACFATGSLFTAMIEPVFMKRKLRAYEFVFGAMVVGALFLIFNVETKYTLGIILGIIAALTSSLLAVMNGYLVQKGHDGMKMSFYEIAWAFVAMSVFVLLFKPWNGPWMAMSGEDLFYLVVLSIAATAVPFLLSLHILKTVSPYTVSLTLNLETVYGTILALILLHEDKDLSRWFYVGVSIIFSTVFLNGWMKMRK
ncbi:MAG TPA: DMT family transporter [Bacteroidia bacterium]|nr:DMT family transporter [Bacteroidia bacterium]